MSDQSFDLRPFPATIVPTDVSVTATLARNANLLAFRFVLTDKSSQVLLPAIAETPARKNNLWEETCFEFFVAAKAETPYWEFNLAPSGNWNVYQFDSYRQGMREELGFSALPFTVNRQTNSVSLDVEIDLAKSVSGDRLIQVGITTAVKLASGEVSYWALAHCGKQPDFHLRESFVAEV
jgi:hypothetical protein